VRNFLTGTDVETERARVIVLEELERKAVGGRQLEADCGTSWAAVGADDVAVAGLEAADGAVLQSLGWLVGIGRALVGSR